MCNSCYDYLIVGSGIYGATFAYLAKQHNKKCLVIEKRPFIGGNIRCEEIEGITVHIYGPHIFHTSDKEVWDFVNRFVTFNNYINSPIANYKGEIYNLPFNMNTFQKLWNDIITPDEAKRKINSEKVITEKPPRNLEEQAISMVGETIYEKLIKGYTEKQWGKKCNELPVEIIKRLPLRFTYNNNYFNDVYQGIPIEGYNTLINKLLDGVDVILNCDFCKERSKYENIADKIVYSGPIDSYFDYSLGRLEYRALRFETEIKDISNLMGNAVVNYTDADVPYTRITEHKHFVCLTEDDVNMNKKTIITKEYPEEYNGMNEPIYPIMTEKNKVLYEQYRKLAEQHKKIIFGGRLGTYRYMDMAPIIRGVLNYWKYEK